MTNTLHSLLRISNNNNLPTPSQFALNQRYNDYYTLSTDHLEVKYTGSGEGSSTVGAVQSNHPIPLDSLFYYFEATILHPGNICAVAIGFTPRGYNLHSQPGWKAGSYGYHADDGKFFHNSGSGRDLGYPKCTTNDVIGAGIVIPTGKLIFTKNGMVMGSPMNISKSDLIDLFPTVGLHSPEEKVRVNFSGNFVFDVENFIDTCQSYLIEQSIGQLDHVSSSQSLQETHKLSLNLVLLHLYHSSLPDAFESFAKTIGLPPQQIEHMKRNITHRRTVFNAIRAGNSEFALKYLEENEGHLMKEESTPVMRLKMQVFLEEVRRNNQEKAIQTARTLLSPHWDLWIQTQHPGLPTLADIMGLLVYPNPIDSPLASLLSQDVREETAELVYEGLLGKGFVKESSLKSAMKHFLCLFRNSLEVGGVAPDVSLDLSCSTGL
ncbi:hypothetical protein P9112_001818 [Eukaryota sp. TZLM1-RC]